MWYIYTFFKNKKKKTKDNKKQKSKDYAIWEC